jgi:hypothetical protein
MTQSIAVKRPRQGGVLGKLNLAGPVVAIPDCHYPFHSKPWLKWTLERIREVQPAYVVQVGDLYDYFALSKYAKTLDLMTPEEEFTRGRRYAEDMWAEVRALVPKARCIQKLGNHDARASKRVFELAPELRALTDLESPFEFEGVETDHDDTNETILGDSPGLFILHGYKSFGTHARTNQAPTITGHTHTGGVVFYQNRFGTFWELNAGLGGDLESPVFRYRNQRQIHGWTLGLGVVDDNGPRFMPFVG